MGSIQKSVWIVVMSCLAARSALAANIKANIVVAPPADGMAYQIGEEVDVGIWLRGETVPITDNLALVQIDLKVTGALIPDEDGDGAQDVFFAPFGPDGLPGPGGPDTSFLGSVPSSVGGGRIYYWIDILNPFILPATDPGRNFVNFTMLLNVPGQVFVNAIGPCTGNDGSSSGAFATSSSNPDPAFYYQSCDSNLANNWVQGVPGGPGSGANMNSPGIMITVVPEPCALGLLALGALAHVRRRAM
jgi:hypothetical protein